jgi:hypothetical protein
LAANESGFSRVRSIVSPPSPSHRIDELQERLAQAALLMIQAAVRMDDMEAVREVLRSIEEGIAHEKEGHRKYLAIQPGGEVNKIPP